MLLNDEEKKFLKENAVKKYKKIYKNNILLNACNLIDPQYRGCNVDHDKLPDVLTFLEIADQVNKAPKETIDPISFEAILHIKQRDTQVRRTGIIWLDDFLKRPVTNQTIYQYWKDSKFIKEGVRVHPVSKSFEQRLVKIREIPFLFFVEHWGHTV